MSEFTAGNLVLNYHKKVVEASNPLIIKPINDNWSVFFTKDTEVSDIYPADVMNITSEVPVLYFYNFEDHGWGFTILYQNKVQSIFDFSYENDEIALQNYVQERFPDKESIELLYVNPDSDAFREKMIEEFYKENSKVDQLKKLIEHLDVDTFALFDFEANKIDKLKEIFSIESLESLQDRYSFIDNFKTIIDIQEMSWIRADRIENLLE
ncbi:hypothetical protein [Paenibacillus glycanilyticus]|uniref:hypothetical protein n=1 Tax=Paenibacillus glycanilyticus TaxID=126569 RepID=UPI000FD7C8F0|nr:hypothetical protein [Paenibacillus glycanilyticus]